MHIERLTMLADMLDNLPPTNFNINHYAKERPACGTTACAVGWAAMMPAFQKQGLHLEWELLGAGAWTKEVHVATPIFEGHENLAAAMYFFELDGEQAGHLFLPSHYGDIWREGRPTQPSDVAARIRTMLPPVPEPSLHERHVAAEKAEHEVS